MALRWLKIPFRTRSFIFKGLFLFMFSVVVIKLPRSPHVERFHVDSKLGRHLNSNDVQQVTIKNEHSKFYNKKFELRGYHSERELNNVHTSQETKSNVDKLYPDIHTENEKTAREVDRQDAVNQSRPEIRETEIVRKNIANQQQPQTPENTETEVNSDNNVNHPRHQTTEIAEAIAEDAVLAPCSMWPESLVGREDISTNKTSLDDVKNHIQNIQWGDWSPTDCQARSKVAIIIPFRDRHEHLAILLKYLHPFLQRQKIHYRIIVVEQTQGQVFNKGRLMNAGFLLALRGFHPDCVVFHDVDLIPEDDHNLFHCSNTPKHMSPALSRHNYTLKYSDLVGGVLMFPVKTFVSINGYSNNYWGWGGEDDDMSKRIKASKFMVLRPKLKFGRYTVLEHNGDVRMVNNDRFSLLSRSDKKHHQVDGINTANFTVILNKDEKTYEHVLVDVGKAPRNRHIAKMVKPVVDTNEPKAQALQGVIVKTIK